MSDPVDMQESFELAKLRQYPELYDEYVQELREMEILDQFVYKLHSLGYNDNEILQILDELESEAAFDVDAYPQESYPGKESYGPDDEKTDSEDEYDNEVKRSEDANDDEEYEEQEDDEDDLEKEFESLRENLDHESGKQEADMDDEEKMFEEEMSHEEEETAAMEAELREIEYIADELEARGATKEQIEDFFKEELGIDVEFEEDEDEDENDDEDDKEVKKDEKDDEDDEEDDEAEDDQEGDENEDEKENEDDQEDEDEEDEDQEDEDEEEDEDDFGPMRREEYIKHKLAAAPVNYMSKFAGDHRLDNKDEDEDEEEDQESKPEMRQRAYPFRKRSLEEVKEKKQDLDEDKEGIAGEHYWVKDNEGEADEKESRLQKMFNQLGYLVSVKIYMSIEKVN